MILLPHGCSCSELAVNPKNYLKGSKSLLKKNWRIHYYFRDPKFKDKYPYGKIILIRGMNKYHTLEERRLATTELIDNELYLLKHKGFNPITKEFNGPDVFFEHDLEIDNNTILSDAIEWSYNNVECAKSTKTDLKTVKKYFLESCKQLRFDRLKIEDIKKRHIRIILENQAKQNGYSNNRYNKIRAYVQILFEQMDEVLEYNPVNKVKLKKSTKRVIIGFKDGELDKIKKHLNNNYYTFYRYVEIFFHSGSRSSELMNLQIKDVNISQQTFKVLVKKGRNYEEQIRAINNNVLHLWIELISGHQKENYVFSKNLCPGPTKINEWQISKRWREHVKIKLGVEADFYNLKHLHTTKVIEQYNTLLAANINGHKSTKMNEQHYDLLRKKRMLDQSKEIDISF